MQVNGKHYRTVWMEGSTLCMIDQPALPHRFDIARLDDVQATASAISDMVVRGAGAIGASAGFGMAQAAIACGGDQAAMQAAAELLRSTRPTAQNLFYAIDRVAAAIDRAAPTERVKAARAEAQAIADEDAAACQAIGEFGSSLIAPGARVLTHCNAGWLAFVDWGSALSPIYLAHRQGKQPFVWVDETRPRCQGARLTCWELGGENVPHALLADNAAGHLMRTGQVDLVIVGADRIAANGDVANKIGTYGRAVLAGENGVPFYVAAPTSTIDPLCATGDSIPIEQRSGEEVLTMWGLDESGQPARVRIAPAGTEAYNPAFDVTPARYIRGIITEKGIVEPGHITSVL